MVIIKVVNIDVYYNSYKALDRVSITARPGEVVGIIGPNGSGKTTLLRTIDGILRPKIGSVYIDGKKVTSMKRREVAKLVGYVPQRTEFSTYMTVLDFVLTGRRPYIGLSYTNKDFKKAVNALKMVSAHHLIDRRLDQLSGGELQRVIIARSLAAEPSVLLLDEPTANLDPRYQIEVLEHIRSLAEEKRNTILVTLHDLTHAYRYSDKVIMMKNGRVFAMGDPQEVITSENIKNVFGLEALVLKELKAVIFR
ncbi:MAG: ABC transporter ATP-binding protein [Desulfurococcales archaeon]|nr:ABC transporter ATP-binding protein [Desulfurococcales archaeon]